VNSWQLGSINQADELEPILAIEQRCFRWPWGRLSFEGELSCQNASNYVVKSSKNGTGEKVVAYAFFRRVADELHLLKIAVTPDYRGRGIATRLLERCFEICAKQGVTSVHLEVRPSNNAAIELYFKLGFEEIGRRHKYYEDTKEDALLMIKNLKEEL
jgi:ribosomal-protein-alanine N-acetyltransferase